MDNWIQSVLPLFWILAPLLQFNSQSFDFCAVPSCGIKVTMLCRTFDWLFNWSIGAKIQTAEERSESSYPFYHVDNSRNKLDSRAYEMVKVPPLALIRSNLISNIIYLRANLNDLLQEGVFLLCFYRHLKMAKNWFA